VHYGGFAQLVAPRKRAAEAAQNHAVTRNEVAYRRRARETRLARAVCRFLRARPRVPSSLLIPAQERSAANAASTQPNILSKTHTQASMSSNATTHTSGIINLPRTFNYCRIALGAEAIRKD